MEVKIIEIFSDKIIIIFQPLKRNYPEKIMLSKIVQTLPNSRPNQKAI
jgi:hypothetical protein|tara:strand:+ start:855 stop:998 length:144 start_codon:yes stop_codon:yes gene_type:complete